MLAAALEDAPFIDGSSQNTSVPGYFALAEGKRLFVGEDPKSGQAKVKSVLAEFLVNAGIKTLLISSCNHLGNDDGCNLNSQAQFKSKEISKSSVIDEMVDANRLLYMATDKSVGEEGERLDHTIFYPLIAAKLKNHVKNHLKLLG